MSIVGRTGMIVFAALLVCGITWGIGRNVTASGGPRGEGPQSGQFQPSADDGGPPAGRGERGRPDRMSGSVFGIVQVLQPLIVIAVLVAVGQWTLRIMRRRFPIGAGRRTPLRKAP